MAEELARQEYVVHGDLDVPGGLEAAIQESEGLRARRKQWPPPNSGEDPRNKGLAGAMDEEMGFGVLE